MNEQPDPSNAGDTIQAEATRVFNEMAAGVLAFASRIPPERRQEEAVIVLIDPCDSLTRAIAEAIKRYFGTTEPETGVPLYVTLSEGTLMRCLEQAGAPPMPPIPLVPAGYFRMVIFVRGGHLVTDYQPGLGLHCVGHA